MSKINFYHLQKQNLEHVLPKLLEKVYALGKNIKIKVGNEVRVEFLNTHLWTYQEESFLPHGSKKDGFAEHQPIWISADDDNPNHAQMLFLIDGATIAPEETQNFECVFNIFDGNSQDAVMNARNFWKSLKNFGAEMHYWQQDTQGRWTEK